MRRDETRLDPTRRDSTIHDKTTRDKTFMKPKRDFGPLCGLLLVLAVGVGFWLLVLWLVGVL